MSKNRMVNTRFWNDSFVVDECNAMDRLLFLYLLTNERTNIIGIYEIPIRTAAFETGIEKDDVQRMIQRLSPKVEFFKGWVYIRRFVDHQASNPSIDRGMVREVAALPAAVREAVIAFGIDSMRLAQAFDTVLQTDDSLSQSVLSSVGSSNDALSDAVPPSPQTDNSVRQPVPKTRVIKSNIIKSNISNTSAAVKPLAHVQMRKDVEEVFSFYVKSFNAEHSNIKLSEKRRNQIRLRIQDAGKEMLFQAITNTANSSFHRGENDRGWKANIDFIIRSYEQVEKLADMDKASIVNKGSGSAPSQDEINEAMKKW